ncbi:hypothetical protein WR25_03834 [Diploscapter pachys]|uniref:CN hydrolase domain-containing protein n=1 Tax=Diploscapter pachys TaxID=2018661 RepID=A0A2A2JYG7_9BILA|nr:hypothetical protein WR25_03834 [Diploscapter pachys]
MQEHTIPVSPVRIAVIQYDPQVGLDHCDGNLSRGLALARRAACEGANLIVLPELANTGYTFNSRAEAYAHAESLDGEVASAEEECILYADVDLSTARSAPIWNSLNDLPRDRRTDLYDTTLGYRLHAPMPR